jgi:hypothetical protein
MSIVRMEPLTLWGKVNKRMPFSKPTRIVASPGAVAVETVGKRKKAPSEPVLTVLPSSTSSIFTSDRGVPKLSSTTPVTANAETARENIPAKSLFLFRNMVHSPKWLNSSII